MSDIAKIKTQQHKLPSINRAKYGKRSGLEGPFMTKSGQVVYYDHKKGQYLDPDKDMYLSYDDWKKLSEGSFWGRDDMVAKSKADDKKHGRVTLRKSDGTGTHGVTTADKKAIRKLFFLLLNSKILSK